MPCSKAARRSTPKIRLTKQLSIWAIRSNQPALVKILIGRGAEVNGRTRAGKMPERRPPGAGGGSHGTGIVRGGWPDRGYQGEASGGLSPLLFAARDGGWKPPNYWWKPRPT